MKSVYLDRSGVLKNTTWAILSPDGKKKLTRAGRGPFYEYRNGAQMAAGMDKIAIQYDVQADSVGSDVGLPHAESVEIGLNISAADVIPMIVVVSTNQGAGKATEKATEKTSAADKAAANEKAANNVTDTAQSLEQKLLSLAWKDDAVIGQFTYAKATDSKDVAALTGIQGDPERLNAILVVEPGQFGLSGKVLSQFDADVSDEDLKSALVDAIANCVRIAKDANSHVELGIKLGIDWKSEIPESDPQSAAARKRKRGN